MQIQFWGVRGSLPAPLVSSQIKSKISAVLEQVTPEDIASQESRERFLAALPPWLFGTVGGNTPCVSVDIGIPGERIVFDSGSGIREMGIACGREKIKPSRYHIFFSHFHWDHLQGFPFFNPAYDPAVTLELYSPKPGLKDILAVQMNAPYFPVTIDTMGAAKTFHLIEGPVTIGPVSIERKKMNHPGDSYSYQLREGDRRFIYATDTELTAEDFMQTAGNVSFFQGADIIVLDCQYTLGEAIDKYTWGHSAFSLAVDFAANWGIKHLVMFHHDPTYNDRKLYNILQSARWYLERMNIKGMELTLATEGLQISL
jgi:phosphoribosyl 1,2-cyclic phosphodiesterase